MMLDVPLPDLQADRPASMSAAARRNRLRLYSDGFIFSCEGFDSTSYRYSTTVLIALGDEPFEVSVGARVERCHAAAFRPLVTRTLRARGVPFICLDLSPNHPRYRAFNRLDGDGMLVVPRDDLAELLPDARAFHEGVLGCRSSRAMLYRAVELAARQLDPPEPLDPRVERVMVEVERNPASTWEQLAPLVNVSRDRFSHLFSRQVGISLRLFAQTMKIHAAARYYGSGMSLTEIAQAAGFADGAHFSKVYSRAFGRPPNDTFHGDSIALYPLPEPMVRQTRRGMPVDTDAVWRYGRQQAEEAEGPAGDGGPASAAA
ncbi:MAG: helix-turn-helix transcriptional regulator [Burkholderiales bacterium]|nr:helix-turn-helix transcriptional regulator [Burkholderiales bacterium]